MVSCAVFSCSRRSESSNFNKDGVSYHMFPKDPVLRKAWTDFCCRPVTWSPKRTSCVCSDHFEISCFQTDQNSRRKMKADAVPTLIACSCKKNCCATGTHSFVHNSKIAVPPTPYGISPSEDPESQPPEISVSVKLEVEDDISEHEDDIMEQLENRKRLLEKDPIAIDTKRVKVEPDEAAESEEQPQYEIRQEPQTSQAQSQFLVQPQQSIQSQFVVPQPQKNKCPKHSAHTQQADNEPEVIPEFFMRVVVQNQTEILKILKQQVLLQDPNPEVLTFLRFLGAKLLRLPKSKRDEIQDKITDMVLLE